MAMVRGMSICAICSNVVSQQGGRRSNRKGLCWARKNESPLVLRAAVSAATEVLRLLGGHRTGADIVFKDSDSAFRITDILEILKADFERSYFLTGDFSSGIYTQDCLFADPTISFKGRDLYRRNLNLLVPFYEKPSLTLLSIEEVSKADQKVIVASWKLRTYLKFPWKPLISLDGSTKYTLNSSYKIISHVESWSISPLEAIGQLFRPS